MNVKFKITDSVQCLDAAIKDVATRLNGRSQNDIGLSAMFPQLWDTPMLGFLGVAAAQDTVAYTVVLSDVEKHTCYVYFDGTYAYTVHEPNSEFINALLSFQLGGVLYASSYEKAYEEYQQPEDQQPDAD